MRKQNIFHAAINIQLANDADLPLALAHTQIPADDVASGLISVLVLHDGVVPNPAHIPHDVEQNVIRQQNQLQPQHVNNARLLIAATEKPSSSTVLRTK